MGHIGLKNGLIYFFFFSLSLSLSLSHLTNFSILATSTFRARALTHTETPNLTRKHIMIGHISQITSNKEKDKFSSFQWTDTVIHSHMHAHLHTCLHMYRCKQIDIRVCRITFQHTLKPWTSGIAGSWSEFLCLLNISASFTLHPTNIKKRKGPQNHNPAEMVVNL